MTMRSTLVKIAALWVMLFVPLLARSQEPGPAAIGPQHPESLQDAILAAARSGKRTITIPPGTYRLQPRGRWHLRFSDLSDTVIDALGVTFLLEGRTAGGIEFAHCKNVTLRGATIRHDIMPFTQGKIVAIGANRRSIDMQVDAGYPAEFNNPRYFPSHPTGYIMDAKARRWKAGTNDYSCERVEVVSPGVFRLHIDGGHEKEPVVVGDPMAFRGNGTQDVFLGDCEHVTLDHVTIQNGGGFCVHESSGPGGNHYDHVTITYGPRPEGATVMPLIACNADAFHSSGVRKGPTLEHCSFEGMPDDGIAIHGHYELIERAEGETLLVGAFGTTMFQPGDPVRVYNRQGTPVGSAVVASISQRRDHAPARQSQHRSFKGRRLSYFALKLDHPLQADFDFLAANPNFCGSGFVARHNTIRNHRARGMLLKADHGLVEGNLVDGSTIAGIVLAPETLYWNEADFAHHVTIRHNTVRYTGYQSTGPWMNQAAGIAITGEGAGIGHEDIVVENNTVEDMPGAAVQIDHAQRVVVRGNKFIRPNQSDCLNGKNHGVNQKAVISLNLCRGIRLEGNSVSGRGPFGAELVSLSPTAENVQGQDSGVSVVGSK